MDRRQLITGAAALAAMAQVTGADALVGPRRALSGGALAMPPFPGDLLGWDAAGGVNPLYKKIWQASFSTPQPALDVYPVNSAGSAGSKITINFKNGTLDLAGILTAQGSSGGFPGNMLATKQLFVTKVYDQSGNGQDWVQATQASMPFLGVFDGIPHICFGDTPNQNLLVSPIKPNLTNQFVAVDAQVYATPGLATNTYNSVLFYTSSGSDLYGIGIAPPAPLAVSPASSTVSDLTAFWRIFNSYIYSASPGGYYSGSTGIGGVINPIAVTLASTNTGNGGNGTIEAAFDDEIWSPGSNPFQAFAGNPGTGLTIGAGANGSAFCGYIDNFLIKNAYKTPDVTAQIRAALRQMRGYTRNNSYNIVLEGDSSVRGNAAFAPYIATVSQGAEAFGLPQHYLRSIPGRFADIATNGASMANELTYRIGVVQRLYQPSAAVNLLVVQIDNTTSYSLSDLNTYAAAIKALSGQNWTILMIGVPDPTGSAASFNTTIYHGSINYGAAGSNYYWATGLTQATWTAATALYTTGQLYAPDNQHLSPIGTYYMAADQVPGIMGLL